MQPPKLDFRFLFYTSKNIIVIEKSTFLMPIYKTNTNYNTEFISNISKGLLNYYSIKRYFNCMYDGRNKKFKEVASSRHNMFKPCSIMYLLKFNS